jgi:hypothetical protein
MRLPNAEFSSDMLLVLHVPSPGLHTSAFCIPKRLVPDLASSSGGASGGYRPDSLAIFGADVNFMERPRINDRRAPHV